MSTGGPGRVGVVIPAAGRGERMGGSPKAFLELAGVPLLHRVLERFLGLAEVRSVAVALTESHARRPPGWLVDLDPRIRVVQGGDTRSASVLAALEALDPTVDIAAIHDAARPFVSEPIVRRCLEAVGPGEGAVSGWPAVDTLKQVDDDRRVVSTPDRARIWRAHTPQVFLRSEILDAYRRALAAGVEATDDAAVFEWADGRVRMVEGSPWNLKVTHPEDLRVAEALLTAGETSDGRV